MEAERLLEDHSDKGLFILLVSEIFQKVFVGFNTRLLSFKQGIFKGEVEKEKKVRYGGKSKGGKGTRKRRVLK